MRQKKPLPPIGMRIMKSAIGVLLVFIIYLLRGRQGAPFYTALSVLWCMQPDSSETRNKAWQRTVGTMIGAGYGLVVILIEIHAFGYQFELLRYVLISAFIIPVIYTTIVFNKKDASYFSCVVFLSIVMLHLTDDNPYIFVLNRVIDTLLGIGLAFLINRASIPRKRRQDILFVSELDDVLLTMEEMMTPYSKFELNKMLDEGAHFTIATMRPPAALIPAIRGVRLKLPVIVMDGAVLYDIKQNRFLKKYTMTLEETEIFHAFFKARDFHCFTNVIIEDSVIIYYETFKNPVEEQIYKALRSSPYRNYIQGSPSMGGEPIYLMLIDTQERIEGVYKELKEAGYTESHKILKYASQDYPGYMYIKIYNKQSSKKNMIQEIEERIGVNKVVALGDKNDVSDLIIEGKDGNEIVKKFKRAYKPYFWQQ